MNLLHNSVGIFYNTTAKHSCSLTPYIQTWPAQMAHSHRLWFEILRIPAGWDVSHRGCVYAEVQTVQRIGVCSAGYGTVHYKEPARLFKKSRAYSPDFMFPPVVILP